MKKILSIALVALLVASTAFAGFSGKAKLSLGYDTESESYGFSNGQEFSVDLDVASETAEAKGEGEVFAGVKATLSLKAADIIGEKPAIFVKSGAADVGFGLFLSLKEAYVAGQDWKVSITGTQNGPDFAKSAIDVVEDYGKDAFENQPEKWWNKIYKAKSYAVSVNKAPGVTATYKDWSVAAGFNGGKADADTHAPDFFNYHVSAISPEVAVAEGISVKIGAVASGIKNATSKVLVGGVKVDRYDESKNFDAFGASAQVAYAAEAFSAKVAGDFGMKKTVGTDDFKADFDVAANVAYAPVAVDVYFSRVKEVNYLSAQVSGAYEGISGKIYAQDILEENKDVTIGADAEYTVDAVKVGAGFWMTTDSKKMEVSGNVEYAAEKFTAKAGAVYGTQIDVEDSSYLRLNASVESSAIIPGATISLGYGPNTDGATGKKTTNLLKEKYGSVTAQCVIAF